MIIFISGNGTGIGKTYILLKIMQELSNKGLSVVGAKPIETGIEILPPKESDGEVILSLTHQLNPKTRNLNLKDISPFRFSLPASPIVAGKVKINYIVDSIHRLKNFGDIVLVEGAGGLLVPVTENFLMVDFVSLLNAKLLLVFNSKLGIINDFLLNKFYLEQKKIPFHWGVNIVDQDYWSITYPYLKKYNPKTFQFDITEIINELLSPLT